MELCMRSTTIPDSHVVSFRMGETRRQASVEKLRKTPVRFPTDLESAAEPVLIEVMKVVAASSQLVLQKGQTDYSIRLDCLEAGSENHVGVFDVSMSGSIWEDEQTAWKHLLKSDASGELPVFFEHLKVSQDGGVSIITGTKDADTDKLWHWSRYVSAASVWISCILNTHYIAHVFLKVTAEEKETKKNEDFLLVHSLKKGFENFLGQDSLFEFDSFVVLSGLEILMLAGLWARLIYSATVICSNTGWKRWLQVQSVFFEQLGTLSVFSAMQLLFYVTPKVFVANVLSELTGREHPAYCRALLHVLFAILCCIIGFDAFLIKVRMSATHFIVDKEGLTLERLYGSAMLLNQILGVVQLTWIVRKRVYRFVFAGPSFTFSDEALVKMDMWNSWVSFQIWRKYKNVFDRLALLTTFSDKDFQLLLLSDARED